MRVLFVDSSCCWAVGLMGRAPASHSRRLEARQVISLDVTSESDPYVVAEPWAAAFFLATGSCPSKMPEKKTLRQTITLAMEHGPFEGVFPIKHGGSGHSIAMLVYQRVVYLPVVRNCREVNRRCGRSPSRIVPIQFGSGVPGLCWKMGSEILAQIFLFVLHKVCTLWN